MGSAKTISTTSLEDAAGERASTTGASAQGSRAGDVPLLQLDGFGPQDLYARREKIFTRSIQGAYQRLRALTGWPLLVGYFGVPWLQYGERQAVLFDLPARQFHIFGLTFWPQDLWLLGWVLMIAAFALFALTTVVGRLWCGYTCPQTVWTAIFMWIEQFAEGARHQRVRLEGEPWGLAKVRKRLLKHLMWLGVALATGVAFVGYFTPIRELAIGLGTLDPGAVGGWPLVWVALFTLATYFNAGWLREQVCIYMCPYARFQSAMIDEDTLIVAYDATRGDPRGARKKSADPVELGLGDCIDCTLCVQVCPTGIDIRDGLQYECIGCAHCIDACNQVMTQMSYPPGLIGYRSQRSLSGGAIRALRPRSIGYGAITIVLCCAFGLALFNRSALAVDVIRERGALYGLTASGEVYNDYQLIILNKSQSEKRVALTVLGRHPDAIDGNHTNVPDSAGPRLAPGSDTEFTIAAGARENLPLRLAAETDEQPVRTVFIRLCELPAGRCVQEATSFFSADAGAAGGAKVAVPGARASGGKP